MHLRAEGDPQNGRHDEACQPDERPRPPDTRRPRLNRIRGRGWRNGRGLGVGGRLRRHGSDRGDEPVPHPRDRFDHTGLARVVVEELPELDDAPGEGVVGHDRVRPHHAHERLSVDGLARRRGQTREHRHHLGLDPADLVARAHLVRDGRDPPAVYDERRRAEVRRRLAFEGWGDQHGVGPKTAGGGGRQDKWTLLANLDRDRQQGKMRRALKQVSPSGYASTPEVQRRRGTGGDRTELFLEGAPSLRPSCRIGAGSRA